MKHQSLVPAFVLIAICHAFILQAKTNDAVKGAGGSKSGIVMASSSFITNYDLKANDPGVTFKLQNAEESPCLWIKAYGRQKNKWEGVGVGVKIEVNNVVLDKDKSILQGTEWTAPLNVAKYMIIFDKYNEDNNEWMFKKDTDFIKNNNQRCQPCPEMNHWYAFDLAGIAKKGENQIKITISPDTLKSTSRTWDGFHIGELALVNRNAIKSKIQEYEAAQKTNDCDRLIAERKRQNAALRFPEGKAPVLSIKDRHIVKDGKPFLQLHVQSCGDANACRNMLFHNWFNDLEFPPWATEEAAGFGGYLTPDWEKQDVGVYTLLHDAAEAYNADMIGDVRYMFNCDLKWVPRSYLKRFPEFYVLDSSGNKVNSPAGGYYPDLGNDKFQEYIRQIVVMMGKKLKGHPGILVHSAAEELRWRCTGTNLPPQDAASKGKYKTFLEEKYTNIAALNREWGANYNNFAEIEPPKIREQTANFLNFQLFRAALLQGYARNIYQAIKQAYPDSLVTLERGGAWTYGAGWEQADDEFGPSKYCDIRTVLHHGIPWGRAAQRYYGKQGIHFAIQNCVFYDCQYAYVKRTNRAFWRAPKTRDERGIEILRGGFMHNSFYNRIIQDMFEGVKSSFCFSYDVDGGHLLHNQKRYSVGQVEVHGGMLDMSQFKEKLPDIFMETHAKEASDANGLNYKLSPLLLPACPDKGKTAFIFSGRNVLIGSFWDWHVLGGGQISVNEWHNLQKLFEHLHVPNEVIIPETFNDELNDYQLLVAGNWATMGSPEMAEKIKSFVEQGKTVVFYPEAFSYDWNTTKELAASPGYGLDKLFCARVKYRLSDKSRKVQIVEDISPSLKKGDTFNVRSLITPLECLEGGKVLAILEETGDPVIVCANNDKTYYLGFMPGISYAQEGTGADDGKIRSLFAWIAAGSRIEKPVEVKGGERRHFVYARSMNGKDYWLAAFLNDYWEKQEIEASLNFLPVNTKYDVTDATDAGKAVVMAKGKTGEDLKKEGIRLSLDALRGRVLVIRPSDQEVLIDCPEYELKALTENNPVDIVLPANCSGSVAEAAQKLLTCLKSKNASVRIVKDDEIQIKATNTSLTAEGSPLGEFHNKLIDTEKNLILIGSSENNRLIANLCQPGNYTYDKVIDDVDETWPGKSRGIIQVSESVNKPYFCPTDKSRDAILAGGSDDAGTVKAMERLVSILDRNVMKNSTLSTHSNPPVAEQSKALIDARMIAPDLPMNGLFRFGAHTGWIMTPPNYDPGKKYPFILHFHGRGGSAERSNLHAPEFSEFRRLAMERGYIVAVPGYGSDCWMNAEAEDITLECIRFLRQRLAIDPKRFYVLGCSMGGGAALTFSARHPEMISAICDIFGVTDFERFYKAGFYNKSIGAAFGGSPDEKPEVYQERSAISHIDVLKSKPLLVIHGDKDDCVPIWNSKVLVEKLKAAGASPEFIIVPGKGHDNGIIQGLENKVLDFFDGAVKK